MRASNWSTTWVAHKSATPRTLCRSKRSQAEVLLGRCVRGAQVALSASVTAQLEAACPPIRDPDLFWSLWENMEGDNIRHLCVRCVLGGWDRPQLRACFSNATVQQCLQVLDHVRRMGDANTVMAWAAAGGRHKRALGFVHRRADKRVKGLSR